MTDLVTLARRIATDAHRGQVDGQHGPGPSRPPGRPDEGAPRGQVRARPGAPRPV